MQTEEQKHKAVSKLVSTLVDTHNFNQHNYIPNLDL